MLQLSGAVDEQAKWDFANGLYLYNIYYNRYLTFEPNIIHLTTDIQTNWMLAPT